VFAETTPVLADLAVYAQWTALVNAQAPRIASQPRSAAYTVGQSVTALSVSAVSRDGGVLSYQWQSGADRGGPWTAIAGATGSSYTPPADAAGVFFYAVEVVNTQNDATGTKTASVNSSAATITVTVVDARSPVITVQPRGGASYTVGATAAPLTVTAESPDGGSLSYQWQGRANSGGPWAAINGATQQSYTPPTTAAGTFSYYVEVTNTNNSLSGTKTASTKSGEATITVTVVNAQAPVITVQPQGATYAINAQPVALTVTAASPDNGVLSYQWQSGANSGGPWTAISGATTASYTPPSSAAYGTVYYRVTVTNTNNALSGAKTAVTDSAEAAIAVVRVNAAAPVISVHPRSAGYNTGDSAEELIVAAESPDEGTLSYHWYSRVGNVRTPITGETTRFYTPSTAVAETVYYYVEVTNTNTAANIDGNTSTTTRSREAKIMIGRGTLNLSFKVWVNDDLSLISNMPENLAISKGLQESLVIEAADDLTALQWSINGADLAGPRGAAQSIAIEAANYNVGLYTLGLSAYRGGIPYSINITFSVVD
jgi:hypothetical protein